ncbi:hypothetical protein [Kitasatospora sp. NPDC057015]|uniref:hypothetical protein n=1 Tax=Kitasatospora sp. NPDC057015 TaxID=3346001 RepID=UPI0036321E32
MLETPPASVDQVLQERIRAGGLPLPGQGSSVPDAFAIAAVLLPAGPAEPHESEPHASRDSPDEATVETAAEPGVPADVPATRPGPAVLAAQPLPVADLRPGGLPPGGSPSADRRPAVAATAGPTRPEPPDGSGLTISAGSPVAEGTAGTGAAVLVPITAGLLLTAAAMCKHRGLPKGH